MASILNIVSDVIIVGLPINEIRRLQLKPVKKVLLCLLFSLGIFVITCNIIRLVTLAPSTVLTDPTCQSL